MSNLRRVSALLLAALPASGFAQSELAEIFRVDVRNGSRVDYRTTIVHNDGSMTVITDKGDVRIVEAPGRTAQTVGRGAKHYETIATHYRRSQGDVIYMVDQLDAAGRPTRLYTSPVAASHARTRDAANAWGAKTQQQQRTQWAEEEERQKRLAQQQAAAEKGSMGGHDRGESGSGPGRELGPAEVSGGPVKIEGIERPNPK